MRKSISPRRVLAVTASTGLAVALAWLPAGGANAKVVGTYEAVGQANANYTGPTIGGTCDLILGDDNPASPTASFSHGTKRRSINLDATFASSDNAADTVRVRGHAASALTLKKRHRDLASFNLGVGGAVKVTHSTSGSTCDGQGSVLAEVTIQFTEHKKGFFTLTRDTKKRGSVEEFILINLKNNKLVTLDFFEGTHSHATSRALLKPGKYAVEAVAGITGGEGGGILKSQPRSTRTALTLSLHGVFKPKQ